ncbi:MAG: PhzF family phenazine biosynthesis isomerase [Candidatus Wallbacteria bacterium]|nr:PhzF family phenazine biosynthesis isomerase [Candidatus Wallbacteria bacterium]
MRIFTVDAFTGSPFAGNPAAVCLCSGVLPDRLMQDIATEMNLSETAFVTPLNFSEIDRETRFGLRWFTPAVEVDLCGHATLASACVLFERIGNTNETIVFETRSGDLPVRREKPGEFTLDFPENGQMKSCPIPGNLLQALKIPSAVETIIEANTATLLLVLADEQEVKDVSPDYPELLRIDYAFPVKGLIVSAAGKKYDCVSRVFVPWEGIPEDPVTGSAHTILYPYWSKVLKKPVLRACQASRRGGEMLLRSGNPGRVLITGSAVTVIEGELAV